MTKMTTGRHSGPMRFMLILLGLGASLFALGTLGNNLLLSAGKTIEIADNVHVIPSQSVPLVPNVGIIVGNDGVLVVDTGMGPANAEIVLAEVRRITSLPIKFLVCTHFHPEHNFGAQSFPPETTIIYSSAQHEDLQRKGELYRQWFMRDMGGEVKELLEPVEIVDPDVTFERQARLNLGGLPVNLLHFGRAAHTGGDTLVYLPEQKILFSGGLVLENSFPIVPDSDSSIGGWIQTLESMRKLDVDVLVPGHGDATTSQAIDFVLAYMREFRSRSLDLKENNVPLEHAQKQLGEEYVARYPDWSESMWIGNAVERVYSESTPK